MKMRADCSRTSQVMSRAFALVKRRADQLIRRLKTPVGR
jgi:hypothetical protein